jgi:hypothetical protein
MRFGRGRKPIASLLVGLSSALLMVGPVFAWPNILENRPANLQPGGELGYYLWHAEAGPAGPGFALVTTGPEGEGPHLFEGVLETDGQFGAAVLIRPEQGDGALVRESEQRIRFQFQTFSRIDGLNVVISGGTHLVLDLKIDGQPAGLDRIFMGQGAIHPVQNPVVLYR